MTHGLTEEGEEVRRETPDGGAVEEVGAVAEPGGGAVAMCGDVEGEVEPGGVVADVEGSGVAAGEGEMVFGCVEELEGDLDERVAAEVALWLEFFDEAFEGEVLVLEGGESDVADAIEELVEGGVSGAVDGYAEGVDEEADEFFELAPVAVGDGCADEEGVLVGVAGEESAEGGEDGHEEGGVVGASDEFEVLDEVGRDLEAEERAVEGLNGRARTVVGEIEYVRGVLKEGAPEGELSVEGVVL